MSDHHLPGEPPVPLILRRSARARRISLRISSLDGRVTLTLPGRVPESEALAFAEEKADWIRAHLANHAELAPVRIGGRLPIEGQEVDIAAVAGRAVRREEGLILVPSKGAPRRLERYLRELARDRLVAASDFYAQQLGRSYSRISLRDTRSRWGSCSAQGALMYSWRLILAPPTVLRYVAAHEVAHLAELNHSRAFWEQVRRIHGPYDIQRNWLRTAGNTLHRYRFEEIDES